MPTIAAAPTEKATRADHLRAESRTLNQELTELWRKLAEASGVLAVLEAKRDALAQEIADGRQQKPGVLAGLHADIATAKMPVEVLQKRVSQTQTALDQTRSALESLHREIALEAQRAARQARFEELEQQGRKIAARIGEHLRALLQEDLPAFDAVRDALLREFVGGRFGADVGPEANVTRALIHELEGSLRDGPFLCVERKLLRDGWRARGDIVLEVKNLCPPQQ
jgi:predicted  nucleic acid-binding Zn-ribbon protein